MFNRLPVYSYLLIFAGFIAFAAGAGNESRSGRAGGLLMIAGGLAVVGAHAIITREWRNGLAGSTYAGVAAILCGVFSVACAAAVAYAAWWTLSQP